MRNKTWLGQLALTFAVLFWGASYVGTKVGLEVFSPLMLAFLRFAVAAALFAGVLVVRRAPVPPAHFHRRVFVVALFLPGLYFIFENYGLQYLSATRAAIIAALIPVAVALMSSLLLRERLGLKRVAAVLLSLLGVGFLCQQQLDADTLAFTLGPGDWLMFGAVVSAAVYMLLVRRLSAHYSSLTITAYQMIYGALLFVPLLALDPTSSQWDGLQGRHLLALCSLSLLSTLGAFVCYNIALQKMEPSRAALGINVVPFITGLGSRLIYNEQISSSLVIGGLLVVAAAVLAHSDQDRQKARGIDAGHT